MSENNKRLSIDNLLLEIEKLKKENTQLKKRKKYGLVWEDKPEKFDEETKNALPVLKEKGGKFKDILDKKNINDDYNILIEGDNYHSLSVLNYTHRNKVDVIYIDPPYNTGNKDFVYNDHFIDREDSFRHSKWLSFMNKRLKLAKSLLKDDGVIFISIDDNEQSQLRLLCDEIFGEKNFIQNFMWLHGKGKKDRWSRTMQQYILCYAKDKQGINPWGVVNTINYNFSNPDKDPRGHWFSGSISFSEKRSNKKHKNYFIIESPSGIKWHRQWQKTKAEMEKLLKEDKIFFGYSPKYDTVPRIKIFPGDVSEQIPPNIIKHVESTRNAQQFLDNLFGKNIFDYPKPVSLIKYLLLLSTKKNSLILDFMAGSGTTGHAVLDLNKEDGGNRKFILCTNNENKICENVTYERIKRISKGYKKQNGDKVEGLGGNLKYLKTDFIKIDGNPDNLKEKIVEASTEILCLKENTFKQTKDNYKNERFKIFENKNKYTAILFDLFYFDEFLDELKKLKDKKIAVYVFSYTKDFSAQEFSDLDVDFTIEAIPEKVLETYKKIFNF